MTDEFGGVAEEARAFIERLMDDDELQVRADEAYVDMLVKLAKEEGYSCSHSELREAMEIMTSLEEGLSDQQLEQVAGGTTIESKIDVIDPIDPVDPSPGKGKAKNQPCPCGSGKKYKHCCGSNKP